MSDSTVEIDLEDTREHFSMNMKGENQESRLSGMMTKIQRNGQKIAFKKEEGKTVDSIPFEDAIRFLNDLPKENREFKVVAEIGLYLLRTYSDCPFSTEILDDSISVGRESSTPTDDEQTTVIIRYRENLEEFLNASYKKSIFNSKPNFVIDDVIEKIEKVAQDS